jgi:hypothetical protein
MQVKLLKKLIKQAKRFGIIKKTAKSRKIYGVMVHNG